VIGTEWTEPGQGSTVKELMAAFGFNTLVGFAEYAQGVNGVCLREDCTNLLLTGAPITEEDWARLESAEFKVGE